MREKFSFTGVKPHLVLEKKIQESREHIVLKLIAYLMFSGRLKVEQKIGYKYIPALSGEDKDGRIIWVECGDVGEKKIAFFRKHPEKFSVFFFKTDSTGVRKLEDTLKKFSVTGVAYGFEKRFIDGISTHLFRTNHVKYKLSGGEIKIRINGGNFSSVIYSNLLKAV
ncbi:MAG: YaeQ family protein [bacterium]